MLVTRLLILAVVSACVLGVAEAAFRSDDQDRKSRNAIGAREISADASGTALIRDRSGVELGVVDLHQKGTRVSGIVGLRAMPARTLVTIEIAAPGTRCAQSGRGGEIAFTLRADEAGVATARLDGRANRPILESHALVRIRPRDAPPVCGHIPAVIAKDFEDRLGGGHLQVEQEGRRVTGTIIFSDINRVADESVEVLPPSSRCDTPGPGHLLTRLRPDRTGVGRGSVRATLPWPIEPGAIFRVRSSKGIRACTNAEGPLVPPASPPEDPSVVTAQLSDREGTPSGLIRLTRAVSSEPIRHEGYLMAWNLKAGHYRVTIHGPGGTCRIRVPGTPLMDRTRRTNPDHTLFAHFKADLTQTPNLLLKGFYAALEEPKTPPRGQPALCGDLRDLVTENVPDFTIETENGRRSSGPQDISAGQFDTVRIVVRADERVADHVIVRGYGIRQAVRRDRPAELLFPASLTGDFDVVMESTRARIATLHVDG